MKKLMIAATIVGLVSLIGFGVALASTGSTTNNQFQPPCPNCPAGGTGTPGGGILHDYMSTALANALGMDVDEFLARHDAGETLYDIAASLNIDTAALVDLHSQARQEAIELAHADGVLTDDQYQFMLERVQFGSGMGFGMGSGYGHGSMQGGGGFGRGQHGGGMWNSDGTRNPDCPNYQAVP